MLRPQVSSNRIQRRLFLSREYEAIKGKGGFVFWMLYSILLVALSAVAIGRTGLDQLSLRMDDPFTTWVDINASNTRVDSQYVKVHSFLNDCARTSRFDAKRSSGGYTMGLESWSLSKSWWEYLSARSFGYHADSSLLHAMMSSENLVADLSNGRWRQPGAFQDGILINQSALEKLGLRIDDLLSRRLNVRVGTNMFPVTVLAIVQTLPARCDVFMEHVLLQGILDAEQSRTLKATLDGVSVLFVANDVDDASTVVSALNELGLGCAQALRDTTLASHSWRADCSNGGIASMQQRGVMQQQLANRLPARAPIIRHEQNYVYPDAAYSDFGSGGSDKFDNLTITFASLDSIGAFQRELASRFRIDLDLDRVRSKENFAIVSNLGEFLIVALVFFSAFSILVFLYNLLKNHLERIKMNLGTFMAFGLSEGFLLRGYLIIIVKLLFRSMLLAMLSLAALQALALLLAHCNLPVPALLANLNVATNAWLYGTLAFLLLAAFVIFRWQLSRFLANTPGDLIYARR